MRVEDLKRFYEYHYWANAKLLAVVATLTQEEFTRPVAGSYGSVRNTLVHILSAEWGWLERAGGRERGSRLDPATYPTFASVLETWRMVEASMRAFLAGLTDTELAREVEFSFSPEATHRRQVAHLLQHAANHAVHHRGQVALLLRMLGYAPGDFDLLYYDGSA